MERREKNFKNVIFVLFIIFFIWILLQFLAPFALSTGSAVDFSGLTGFTDNKEAIEQMSFPWNYVYLAGDIFCRRTIICYQ